MPEAVIVDAIRTPIGRAFKGSLKDVRADDLAAVPIKAILERNPDLDPSDIDDVMTGAAFHAIAVGEGDTYLATGVEAVSRASSGADMPFHPKLAGGDDAICNVYIPMGLTAENVAEQCGVSREAQDEWAAISQNRAVEARDSGHFDPEIVPVVVPEHTVAGEDGAETTIPETTVSRDDGPRPGTTKEKLAELKPAFKPDGTVTAGNACPLNDGAAAVLVMSAQKAKALGKQPKARIVASAVSALRPELMGLGPVEAVRKVLKQAGMTIEDIDVVELNEAFAAQVIPCMDELGIDAEKLNPFGGAIALGHPFGMTGARIMTTLLNDLETLDKTYGLETMCVAGGQGQAMIVERLS